MIPAFLIGSKALSLFLSRDAPPDRKTEKDDFRRFPVHPAPRTDNIKMNGVSGQTGDEEKNMLRQFTEGARKACEWATLWGRDELSAEVSQPVRVEFELLEPRLLLDG
jgi:hypothetical protein